MTSRAKEPSAGRSREPGVERAFSRARWALLVVVLLVLFPSEGLGNWLSISRPESAAVWLVFALWVALGLVDKTRVVRSRYLGLESATFFLIADVGALTAILFGSGAATNPFTMLYFVPIALGTLLEMRSTILVAAAAVLGFLVLLARTSGEHAHHGHMLHHVTGMAVALAFSGALVTYFVHRVSAELGRERRRVERLEKERENARVATSLGALAAGAAHELGTPLGTVQLLAEEIPAVGEEERLELRASIEAEVKKMKEILRGLVTSELSLDVLRPEGISTSELAAELAEEFGGRLSVEVSLDGLVKQPRVILRQTLRELVVNALRAQLRSGQESELVRMTIGIEAGTFSVRVDNRGERLTTEQRESLFQPFVSFSGGRGLGLFLARTHARQLGGELEYLGERSGAVSFLLTLPLEMRLPARGGEA